jgi:hypothetical protein
MSPLDPRVPLLRSSPSVGAVLARARTWPRAWWADRDWPGLEEAVVHLAARTVGCDGAGALASRRGGR